MMTTFTLLFALTLGVACVRSFQTETAEIQFDSAYFTLLDQRAPANHKEVASIEVPDMKFGEIRIPRPVKTAKIGNVKRLVPVEKKLVEVKVAHNELPFQEPIRLKAVSFHGDLLKNVVTLYHELPVVEKVLVAETSVKDEVKTVQSSEKIVKQEQEPEFFEYEKKEDAIEVGAVPEKNDEKEEITKVEVAVSDLVAPVEPALDEKPAKPAEEANLIAFDYSGLKQDLRDNKVPTVSMVDTQPGRKNHHTGSPKVTTQQETAQAEKTVQKNALVAPKFSSQMTIQGVASDLKSTQPLQGFEVRFQDNTSETHDDYGDGEVTVSFPLAQSKMTRSMVLLKRGFAPTNTDLILEDGAGSVSIPALPEDLINDLSAPFEVKGTVGTLLIELADETDKATIDVPFGKVITLDGDMRETNSDDFRYQLFIGVRPGNALLTYVHGNETTSKIVHVHEHEVTYESNFFERNTLSQISLFQEDLLSHEKSPLVTASENVRVFAKNVHGEKLNQNTYKIDFGPALLGGRNYIELGHEEEPVFVGTRDQSELSVPSESFMRHILSSLPEQKIGNRCVIQVNLRKKVSEIEVAAESVGESLMVTPQFLDADGKFYESASNKTRKIIVFGENQGSGDSDMTGKVNLKVQYLDGSYDFLGTYCSPNTYLVEQL